MHKLEKNYFRNNLTLLIERSNGKPIIVDAKYKYTENDKWATFTCVRPYVPNVKTCTLCDHINIDRYKLMLWYNLDKDYHNRKFYIIGYPFIYSHYGIERGGIKLAEDFDIKPIIFNEELSLINNFILEKCYQFNENEIYFRVSRNRYDRREGKIKQEGE